MPFLSLAIIHSAQSHLLRAMGESSKIVPTLTLNCCCGCRVLHWNSERLGRNVTASEPQVGQRTTPSGQRSETIRPMQASGLLKYSMAWMRVLGSALMVCTPYTMSISLSDCGVK